MGNVYGCWSRADHALLLSSAASNASIWHPVGLMRSFLTKQSGLVALERDPRRSFALARCSMPGSGRLSKDRSSANPQNGRTRRSASCVRKTKCLGFSQWNTMVLVNRAADTSGALKDHRYVSILGSSESTPPSFSFEPILIGSYNSCDRCGCCCTLPQPDRRPVKNS